MSPTGVNDEQLGDELSQRVRARADHWSDEAAIYDERWQTREGKIYADLEAELLIQRSGAAPGRRILELCCGTGRNTLRLAATGAEMVGVDNAEKMLEIATRKVQGAGLNNVRIQPGNIFELDFPDATFDAVVGTRFMYMMSAAEKRLIVEQVRRVLKPNGMAVIHFNGCLWGLKTELLRMLSGKKPRPMSYYLWPTQAARIFEGFEVKSVEGIKFPQLGVIQKLVGSTTARTLNSLVRLPLVGYLTSYLLVSAVKRSG